MIIRTQIAETQKQLKVYRKKDKTIGFIPTMGALHEGHLALIHRSKSENDITVCSIFVNPIQFNNTTDLNNYPRTLERDKKILEKEGVDLLFAPEAIEIYPPGETQELDLDMGRLDKVMEGKHRPGHFMGVAIVVEKLFNIIGPTHAYFGKKDFQQLTIIQHMVKKLNIPVEIVPCETFRESDGLAMSSRNLRLSIGERHLVPKIYDVLMYTKANAGTIPVQKLQLLSLKRLMEVTEFRVEYFEIVNKQTLLPVDTWDDPEEIIACAALHLGDIRLIDNMELFL